VIDLLYEMSPIALVFACIVGIVYRKKGRREAVVALAGFVVLFTSIFVLLIFARAAKSNSFIN